MKYLAKLTIVCVAFCVVSSAANAHDAFKEPLEERYNLRTVSCKTCHPNNKDRSIHNLYGKLFEDALKGKDINRKFKEAEAKGDEAKAAYEKVMVEEFKKAMVVVEKKQLSFKEFIAAGLLNGTRLAEPKDEEKDDE